MLYFILWEAVHHVDVLFRAGGGALAVLQHVFPFALVGLAAGFAGGGAPAPVFHGSFCWAHAAMKNSRKPAEFDKYETLQDRF